MTSEIRANTLKNRVGLGTVSFTDTGPVVSGIVTANGLELNSVDTGSSAGPELKLFRNSASPADADYLGQIKFQGESDTSVQRNYAKITGKILDASNGTEDGILEFAHIKAGSQTITGRWRSDSLQLLNGTALTVAGNADFSAGIDVTGNAGVSGNISVGGVISIPDTIQHVNDTDTKIRFSANDVIRFETGGAARLILNNDNIVQQSGTFVVKNATSDSNGLKISQESGDESRIFNHYSGSLTFGTANTERLRITSTGSVGIGTNNPNVGNAAYPVVQVHGTSTNAYFKLTNTTTGVGSGDGVELSLSGSDAYLTNRESANIIFRTGGSNERLRIRSDGNVDINGTPPWTVSGGDYRNLSISGQTASSSGFIWLGNGTATTNADFDLGRINFMNGGTVVARVVGSTDTSANDDGRLRFITKKTGQTEAERLRITSDGNVSLGGETNPITTLTINTGHTGNNTTFTDGELIRLEGYGDTNSLHGIGFHRYNGGANGHVPSGFIGAKTGTWSSYTNCHLIFATRDTTTNAQPYERVRIRNSGEIAIGDAANFCETSGSSGSGQSSAGSSGTMVDISNVDPGRNLYTTMVRLRGGAAGYVHSSLNLAATSSENSSGNYRGLGIYMNDEAANNEWYAGRPYSSSNQYMIAYTGTVDNPYGATASTSYAKLRIQTNGNYNFSGSNTSDRDLKENIATLSGTSLDKILQLTPKTFNFKPETVDTPDGFPSPPSTETPETKTGFIAQEVQSVLPSIVNGTDGQKDMGIDYNGLIAHMVNAIKELKAEVDILKGS